MHAVSLSAARVTACRPPGAVAPELTDQLQRALRFAACLQRELRALEQVCLAPLADESAALREQLRGSAVLYIGGRPDRNRQLQALVRALGARWLHHAGGVTGHEAALQALLAQTCLAVVPGDYLDDDSLCEIEILAAARGVRFRRLRDSSAGAFAAALADLGTHDDGPALHPVRSTVCPRHG